MVVGGSTTWTRGKNQEGSVSVESRLGSGSGQVSRRIFAELCL